MQGISTSKKEIFNNNNLLLPNMKKRFVFLVSLIVISLFILSCTQQVPEVVEETVPAPAVEEAQASPEATETTSAPVVETPKEAKEETEPVISEYQVFQPKLKYEGAYNGPLYATSEQVGGEFSMEKYFSNLDRNGVNWFVGFFTYLEKPQEDSLVTSRGLGRVIDAVQRHPLRVVPYYNLGMGGKEVEPLVGDKLTALYTQMIPAMKEVAGPNFLRGLGEIETQEWSVAHNDPKVLQLFNLAKSHTINFMFHPVASKIEQVDQITKAYPTQNIIIHMYRDDLDKSRSRLIEILNSNKNLYFSIDAAHIAHSNGMDILYDYDESSAFISEFDTKYKTMLNDAVSDYKSLVEGAPDKVMWGTEAGPEYSFEPAVYDRLIKMSRELIGQMKPEHQEALGYKNALRAFGNGVALEKNIVVLDNSNWEDCTGDQIGKCDVECGVTDETKDPALESCFQACLLKEKCLDVLEKD